MCSLWQHRFDHRAQHPSSLQRTICGALMSTSPQGCSTTWPVLHRLSGHTPRLDSLRHLASTLSVSHLLPWCVFLLFQSACRTPRGRLKESQSAGATSLAATVVLGWHLSPWHPNQLGWCARHYLQAATTSIFQHGPILHQQDSKHQWTGVNPYVNFFPVDTPFSLGRVLLCRSLNIFCNHSGEEGITHLIISSWGYHIYPAFYYAHCCAKSAIHWQVPHKFSAQGKNSLPCENFRNAHNHTSIFIAGCLPPPTSSPSMCAPSSSRSESLQSRPNCANFARMCDAGLTSSLM